MKEEEEETKKEVEAIGESIEGAIQLEKEAQMKHRQELLLLYAEGKMDIVAERMGGDVKPNDQDFHLEMASIFRSLLQKHEEAAEALRHQDWVEKMEEIDEEVEWVLHRDREPTNQGRATLEGLLARAEANLPVEMEEEMIDQDGPATGAVGAMRRTMVAVEVPKASSIKQEGLPAPRVKREGSK